MTVALNETGYAFGRFYWDGGDGNVMETSYMCTMEFLDVSGKVGFGDLE